jgi:ribonuclease P protein component
MDEQNGLPQPASYRFGPDRRLRRRLDFQRVFDAGFRVHGRFITLVIAGNAGGPSRLGIVASRKLGNAVRRNRAKRLIRDIFRQCNSRPGLDVVVIPRRELFDASYSSLETDFRGALTRGSTRAQRHARE